MKSLTIIAGFICATAVSSLLLACQPKAGPDTNHPGGQTPPVPEKGTLELKLPEAPAQA